MNNDFPDYADLISQYEATEYDMLNSLHGNDADGSVNDNDSGDVIARNGYNGNETPVRSDRRKNSPALDSDSDSDGGSGSGSDPGALDDDDSQTSYEEDNGGEMSATTDIDNYESDKKEDDNENGSYSSDSTYEDDNDNDDVKLNVASNPNSTSQYESAEYSIRDDMNGSNYDDSEKGMPIISNRRKNTPSLDSDSKRDIGSGSESRASEDDYSQSSYEEDNDDKINFVSEFEDDESHTEHNRSEDSATDFDDYESDKKEKDDESGSYSSDSTYEDDNDHTNRRNHDDIDKGMPIISDRRNNTPSLDSNSNSNRDSGSGSGSESRALEDDYSQSSYEEDSNNDGEINIASKFEGHESHAEESRIEDSDNNSNNSDVSSEYSSFASDSEYGSQKSGALSSRSRSSNGDSNTSYDDDLQELHSCRENMDPQPDSARSLDSYETAGSDEFETSDIIDNNKETQSTASDDIEIQSSNDESNRSDDNDSDDDEDDDDLYIVDDSDSNQDFTLGALGGHVSAESPSFNNRGDSKHSFKHPSVASDDISNSTSESGWQDSDDQSTSVSRFENEHSKMSPKRRGSTFDIDNIESVDDSQDSEDDSDEEFEDEPHGNNTKNTKSKRNHSYDDDESENEHNEFESILSNSKREKSRAGKTSLSSFVSSVDLDHIVSREKIVVDRENTVNTRERRFTRWFIAVSVLVLIGAIILVSIYFTRPSKSADSPAPTSLPVAIPATVPIAMPTVQPSISPPILENKVLVETTFLAFVPNGKADGVTLEVLEEGLTDVMGILLPSLLADVLSSNDNIFERTRNFLRTLQQSNEDNIAILEPISVDVLEVECPVGNSASDLCVKVTTNVPIVNSSNNFTREDALELENAYSTAVTKAIDGGIVQELDLGMAFVPYTDGVDPIREEPTKAPITSSDVTMEPSMEDSQSRGSLEPTMAPTAETASFTLSPTSNPATLSPTSSDTSIISSMPSPSIASEDDSTLNPTSFDSFDESGNVTTSEDFPTISPDVFPCTDENDACEDFLESGDCSRTKCVFWTSENECSANPEYMIANCRKSCGLCGDPGLPVTPTDSPSQKQCSDQNDLCGEWALQNECTDNPAYMELNCKNSCGFCGCTDKNDECSNLSSETNECVQTKCELWTSEGECDANSNYMNVNCRKSCDLCGDASDNFCKDSDERCAGWANEGECIANPNYMQQMCAESCGLC